MWLQLEALSPREGRGPQRREPPAASEGQRNEGVPSSVAVFLFGIMIDVFFLNRNNYGKGKDILKGGSR